MINREMILFSSPFLSDPHGLPFLLFMPFSNGIDDPESVPVATG